MQQPAGAPRHIVIDARIRRASTGRPIDRLIEYLQDIDHHNRYTILVSPGDDWHMRAPNFTVQQCPYPQFSLNPLHQIGFVRQLHALKPDLVHFTMTQQPLFYFGTIVTMTHDSTMYHFVRRGKTPLPIYKAKMALYTFLVWWSHRKSKKIIFPTQTVAREFMARQPFIKDKIVVINEAAEPASAYTPVRPAAITENERFILYVGTAFPHKNLPMLISAFEALHARQPDLKLVFAGKREKHYEELEQVAAASPAASHIIFTGYVSDEELSWLYAHTQAYVFVSLSEGWGLPPLEAMAHSAPVISSNKSVMPEVYGDAVLYCDPRNPADIAAKITELLDNPDLRNNLITKGHAQLAKYSWQRWAAENHAVYEQLLKA